MEKYFCNYEQSLALKELGFKERVNHYFEDSKLKLHFEVSGWDFNTSFTTCVSAPLKSQVFEWFREEHNVSVTIDDFYTNSKLRFDYSIRATGSQEDTPTGVFKTYEEAESTAINKLIELLKWKK